MPLSSLITDFWQQMLKPGETPYHGQYFLRQVPKRDRAGGCNGELYGNLLTLCS